PFFGYAFLGFKKAGIPINGLKVFRYSEIKSNILEKYFRIEGIDYRFFNPFNGTKRWVTERYESTSLQRVISNTFSEAFLREPNSHGWGCAGDYVDELRRLMRRQKSERLPLLDIAVWLYRKESLVTSSKRDAADQLVKRLIRDFHLTEDELDNLFDGL